VKRIPPDTDIIFTAYLNYAQPSDDNIEIDDEVSHSSSGHGCWVKAWVYVDYTNVFGYEDEDYDE
jgi:hypothetical protein